MRLTEILILISLLTLAACGGGGGGGGSDAEKQEEIEAGEAGDGIYYAHLRPLNSHANGFLPHGRVTLTIDGDKLSVKTYLDDDSSVTHRQSIHIGTKCPDASHDSNRDGFVDYQEALRAVGKVMIPLDGDLSSQEKGAEIYPRGTSFTYQRSGFISEMLEDLWTTDSVPDDEFIKFRRGQGMKMVGRVVLVHGTFSTSSLPASLSTRGGDSPHLALPVVCGIISPVP